MKAPLGLRAAAGSLGIACLAAVSACSSSTTTGSSSPAGAALSAVSAPSNVGLVTAPAGYTIQRWAGGTGNYTGPDAIVFDGNNVWIGYQNGAAKDGTDTKMSALVEFTLSGQVERTVKVGGHCDGLRVDPSTHLLWATSNEDGNPRLFTVDQTSGQVTEYKFPAAPHGGGYDDVYFLNGSAFIAASNPTLDASGNNPNAAVDKVTLSGSNVVLTPVLMGNAKANAPDTSTTPPGVKQVTLTLTDPDSLSVDAKGDLVLVAQADSALITIANPGAPQQTVTELPVGTQLDDTIWTTSERGKFFIVDGVTGIIYTVAFDVPVGTIFTEAPDDSGVAGFVGTVSPATGFIHPVITGLQHPTGLALLPA